MSIVTFWNDDREQSGRTLTSVAVATRMAIERNFKILLISTSYGDSTMKNCFFLNEAQRNMKLFGTQNNIAVESGIEGLSKLVASNKITPTVITDYTKVVFKGRLEVLYGADNQKEKTYEENAENRKRIEECYLDLIRTANQYYDMVIVDLDKNLNAKIKNEILQISNLNVLVVSQKLQSLNRYKELRETSKELSSPKYMLVIGRYMDKTKYNIKNVIKYLGEKKDLSVIPFNVLYYEASEEAAVPDLFLKLKNIKDTSDDNYIFMKEIMKLIDKIIKRLRELQMKMR